MKGGGVVLIKNKDHDPYQKDKELHGYFKNTVEDQSQLTFPYRFPGEVPLYLALVRSKIGQGQKETSRDSTPERVSVFGIKVKIQDFKFVVCPCNF